MSRPAIPLAAAAALTLSLLAFPAAAEEAAAPPAMDEFIVALPDGFSAFETQTQTIQSQSGPIENVTRVSKSEAGDAIIVSYSEFTGPILNPNQMMEQGFQSLLKSVGATAETQSRRELDARPGLDALFGSDKLFGRTQLGVDGDRMYQIIYLSPDASRRSAAAADAFFSSFRFRDPVAPQSNQQASSNHPSDRE
jgi:hypothetical protein